MPCPICGEICRCSAGESSAASLPDAPDAPCSAEAALDIAASPTHSGPSIPKDPAAWRQEVAARLNHYHARRKPRPPRYPSLQLRFDVDDPTASVNNAAHDPVPSRPVTHQALALDGFRVGSTHEGAHLESQPEIAALAEGPALPRSSQPPPPTTAKIIEFPRSAFAPPVPLEELAEPVFDRPRILEVPEVAPPPPALGGITIGAAQSHENEKRPGIDIPLLGAPLARRIFAGILDGVIIAGACALFGWIFWKITSFIPARLELVGLAAAAASLFWAGYQYLHIVYSGTTPGLRLAGLELARFDGSPAARGLRRWRVLASYLSALSLGMGYLWVFLDEDALCWHDRITHTYFAPHKRADK